jgi:enhancing lycopene biosynthesis protein 2
MKKVAVILSGCGHKDGAEIREAVLSLLYLDKNGAFVQCFAPSIPLSTINHLSDAEGGTRNVLEEAARIARGDIKDLKELKASDFDALVLPGGYGAAKNLSNLAVKGGEAKAIPEYERVVKEFNTAGKPIGAICISPAVLVAALRKGRVTIGNDKGTASAIEAMGGQHDDRQANDICIDETNRIISTPAYMYDETISNISEGIEKLVKKTLELA